MLIYEDKKKLPAVIRIIRSTLHLMLKQTNFSPFSMQFHLLIFVFYFFFSLPNLTEFFLFLAENPHRNFSRLYFCCVQSFSSSALRFKRNTHNCPTSTFIKLHTIADSRSFARSFKELQTYAARLICDDDMFLNCEQHFIR